MNWAVLALLSACTLSVVVILDKRLLSVNIRNSQTYYAWLALSLVIFAALVYFVFGIQEDLSVRGTLTAFGAGAAWGVGLAFFFVGIKMEDASRAAAVFQTYPIFVAIFAGIFLDEAIGASRAVAILAIVAGAYMVSLRELSFGAALRPSKALPFLILASFSIGMGFFGNKVALGDLSLSTVYVFRSVGMVTSLLFFFRPRVFPEMAANFKDPSTRYLIFLNLFILAPFAVALSLIATSIGPVSLVSSVAAASPMLVFVLTALLSKTRLRSLGEPLQKETLAIKGPSVCLVVGGLIALQLV